MKKNWDSSDIQDQKGRVAVVSGASSGIGFETARVLAEKKATLIMAVRNQEKGEAAWEKIISRHKEADVSVLELDLADLQSVRKFAGDFSKKYTRLDLLINNAGVMMPPYSKTADGFELQFGTNHLGHFALTALLFDVIKTTPDSRIVNVSSAAEKMGRLDFTDLNWETRPYKKWQAYGDTKIANIYFTLELKRRMDKAGLDLIAASSHPGWTVTELQRHSGFYGFLNPYFGQGIEMGALPTLYAALGPDVESGDYYGPSGIFEWRGYPRKVKSGKRSHDEETAAKLWAVSEEMTGAEFII